MNLAPVRSDHADVLGRHPVLPHAGDLLDVLKHGDSFLDVEEARTTLLLQVLPNDTVEDHGNFVPPGCFWQLSGCSLATSCCLMADI